MTTERTIQHHLSEIASILQGFGIASVGTDYVVTGSGAYRRCVVLHRHGKRKAFAVVSPRPEQRENGLRALRTSLGMDPSVGNRLLVEAEALSELNDLGAWPLIEDDRAALVATRTGVGYTGYCSLPGMEEAYLQVQAGLPNVARVVVRVSTLTENSRKSRKGWLHFYDAAGTQMAAITTNMLVSHLRTWFDLQAPERQAADRHLKRWATQLGASQADFMQAMLGLTQLDTYMAVTGVDLTRE